MFFKQNEYVTTLEEEHIVKPWSEDGLQKAMRHEMVKQQTKKVELLALGISLDDL